jgi:hypothetical protein
VTTAIVDQSRRWVLSTLTLVLAAAALAIAVIALVLARDDPAAPVTPSPRPPVAVTESVTPLPFYGCDGVISTAHRC